MIHIEFTGANGCGKTTLFHALNKEIAKKHGKNPSFKTMLSKSRKKLLFQRILKRLIPNKHFDDRILSPNIRHLARFVDQHSNYFQNFFTLIFEKRKNRENQLWRLFLICNTLQYAQDTMKYDILTFDHGFLQTAALYFEPETKTLSEAEDLLVSKAPSVYILINVKSDINQNIHRIRSRRGGAELLYKTNSMSNEEIEKHLRTKQKQIDKLVSFLPSRIKIIEVDNTGLLTVSVDQMLNGLKDLL